MKTLFTIASLTLALLSPALAQVNDPETPPQDQQVVEKIQNLRIAYISEKLGLTPAQAEKFWPVYREFVQQRAEIRNELKLFKRENINPAKPDPVAQQKLVDLGLQVKQRELDLEKEYSGRMLKVIDAQQVLNLRKAEQDFRTMLINQMPQRKLMQERKENLRDKNQRLRQKQN